jgi:hypothetical protein
VVSVCVGSAWKILPVTVRSLWSVLGGEGRESPMKHGARGANTGGGGQHGGTFPRRGGDQHGQGRTSQGEANTGEEGPSEG